MFAISFGFASAQANVVKGLVRSSEDDSPLVGAAVALVVDSIQSASAATGNKGDFLFSLPEKAGVCTIIVNLMGYEPHIISITNVAEDVDFGKIYLSPTATLLDEVEVTTSSRVIALPDKSIIFPTATEKERATSPLNLLTQISFAAPKLKVNEQNESVSIGGKSPQILINGVKRSLTNLNALDPKDILKIEYITHADMRYKAPYINIVTVRPPTGGVFLASLKAPVTTRQENHQIYSAYRRGKHEVAVNYDGSVRDSRKTHRNVTEEYFYPDRTYEIDLEGTPSRLIDRFQNVSVDYTLMGNPRKFLVATAALAYHSQNSHISQMNDGTHDSFDRHTDDRYKTLNPSLNIYGSLPVTDNGRLEANLSGAYQSGDYLRALSQTNGYADLTSTHSGSYTFGGDLFYEHRFSWAKLNATLSQTFSRASNDYEIEGSPAHQILHKSHTAANVILSGQAGRILYYYAALGLEHTRVEKGYTSPYAYLVLQKSIQGFTMQYDFSATSHSESLSSYNDVVLPVNEILYRTGNTHLKDQQSIKNGLSASYSRSRFSADLSLYCQTSTHQPITVCEYIGDPDSPLFGKFLETTGNSRRSNSLGANLSIGLSNLLNHFSLSLSGSYTNERTRGYGHRWRKSCFTATGYAAAFFGPWQFGVWADPFPSYSLYGNFLWRNYTGWGVSASWRKGPWAIRCSLSDLFSKKAYYQERTTFGIGSTTCDRSWIADKNNMVELTIRYQFKFGETANKSQRNLRGNTRVDSGVSTGY